MKFVRKIMSAIMILILVLSNNTVAYAAESNHSISIENIDVHVAEKIAITHIYDTLYTDSNSLWNNGVKINCRKALFDTSENISAYYFGLIDKNNQNNGYIITSANTAGYPVLEFAESGNSFINEAIAVTLDNVEMSANSNVSKSKVYYMGGFSYAVEHLLDDNTKIMYDITSSNIAVVDKKNIHHKQKKNDKKDYSDDWNIYKNKHYGQSNPPNSAGAGYIMSPEQYESGYINDAEAYLVTNGGQKCFVLKDFADYGVCSPTAAINLCRYWYRRDKTKYGALCKNNSWTYSFWLMHDLMKTTEKNGTYASNMPDGYKLYFDACGLSCQAYLCNWTNNGRYIVDELNNNRPCHLNVNNHYAYGNHSVFAVGYKEFIYNKWYGKSYSTYIRIADGYTPYPNRYVWGGCTGDWNYIVVIPD